MKKLFGRFAIAAALGAVCATASAAPITMKMSWSGAVWGNSAIAHGMITFDDSLLATDVFVTEDPRLHALTLTVSGLAQGNGTWGKKDFGMVIFKDTAGLDFSRELVGQPMAHNCAWGVERMDCHWLWGDFNLMANRPDTPQGTFFFEMTNPTGEVMRLTSMRKVDPAEVPEPASIVLFGLALAGAAAARRKKAR